jgi:hypothetical protein
LRQGQICFFFMLASTACGGTAAPVAARDPCFDLNSSEIPFSLNCEFSLAANPNGPWQYGCADSLGGQFHLVTVTDAADPVGFWLAGTKAQGPFVAWNDSSLGRLDPSGSWAISPHQIAMLPSGDGKYAAVQFTVPRDLTRVTVGVEFEGLNVAGDTHADVHFLLNGHEFGAAIVTGYGGDGHFRQAVGTGSVSLSAVAANFLQGDVLSFEVGTAGASGNAFAVTGLEMSISPTP